MNTKSKNAIIIVVAAVVAYALGAVIGLPSVSSDLSKGDVGKVARYSRSVVSPTLSLVQEKLQADSIYRTQTLSMFQVVSARLSAFESLCELSTQSTEGKNEFEAINTKLQANIPTAKNAARRGEDLMKALNDLVDGKKVDDFEQLSNNLILSYLIIDKEVSLGKSFVEVADTYLDKQSDDKLAFVRDMWMDYCSVDAYLNGNQSDAEYWSNKDYVLSSDEMTEGYKNGSDLAKSVQAASQLSVGYFSFVNNKDQFQTQDQFQTNDQFKTQDQFQTNDQFKTMAQFQTLNGGLSEFATNFTVGDPVDVKPIGSIKP